MEKGKKKRERSFFEAGEAVSNQQRANLTKSNPHKEQSHNSKKNSKQMFRVFFILNLITH